MCGDGVFALGRIHQIMEFSPDNSTTTLKNYLNQQGHLIVI